MAVEGYDLVMIGLLAVTALLGYFKGMVWQLAWIAGIVASSFVALRFAAPLAPYFGQQAPWNRYIAMLALYAGTSLVVWLVFRMIAGAINAVHLSAFDHQLGLLLGLAKGALLCVVITFFSVTLAPAYRHQIVASYCGRFVADLIVRADTYLPKEIHDTVDPFVKQFERQFAQPGDGRADAPGGLPGFGQSASASPAGQELSLQSLIQGVSSAAAWAGAEQGGVQQAGGTLPPGSAWFVPRGGQPQSQAIPSQTLPAGFQSLPVAPAMGAPQTPLPPRTNGSRYGAQIGSPPSTPSAFPVGAQTPLPVR